MAGSDREDVAGREALRAAGRRERLGVVGAGVRRAAVEEAPSGVVDANDLVVGLVAAAEDAPSRVGDPGLERGTGRGDGRDTVCPVRAGAAAHGEGPGAGG